MTTTKSKTRFSKIIITVSLCILLLAIGSLSIYFLFFHGYNKQKKSDLALISSAMYDGIFCSMFSIENYSSDTFSHYRGLNILTLNNSLRNTSDLGEYLSGAFASGNPVDTIYIGLDPAKIWESSHKKIDNWNTSVYENILSYAIAHPETTFEVLLPAPSMEYWLEHSEEETDEILTNYQSLASLLQQQSNIITFFMGAEEWLISNPANYCDHMSFNSDISLHIVLSSFCDRKYMLTADNAPTLFAHLKDLVLQKRTAPTKYPDLSHMDIVFLGDSIIGNYTDSSSIPDVISALSHASTYNCAQGGLSATYGFVSYAEAFISADSSMVISDGPFTESLERYLQDEHTGQQLVFVLNFGLNDYFSGCPIENASGDISYADSLREGIRRLQSAYPEATILLMAPTYTTAFTSGSEIMSEKGSVLTEYVDTALEVANEMNIICLNNYSDLGVDENTMHIYSDDEVHLNGAGRFLLSQRIIETLAPLSHQ